MLPWYIGIAIVLLGELYIAYQMFYVGCPAPVLLELGVLVVIPLVYLTLMYLTFISQDLTSGVAKGWSPLRDAARGPVVGMSLTMPMPPAIIAILLLSLLSILTTLGGVLLAVAISENAKAIATGIGFSTGIMILVSAFELVPESRHTIGAVATGLTFGIGAFLLWLANFVLPHTHLVREHELTDTRLVRSASLVVAGLILHDVPEGFAMANAYLASPSLGLLVALAIALHNLPEELAMAVPVIALRSRRFLLEAAFLSALAEPLGAVLGLLAVAVDPSLNAYFMAFAAGAMIFVSIHELIPMARRYRRPGWFIAGIALSIIVYRALAQAIGIGG